MTTLLYPSGRCSFQKKINLDRVHFSPGSEGKHLFEKFYHLKFHHRGLKLKQTKLCDPNWKNSPNTNNKHCKLLMFPKRVQKWQISKSYGNSARSKSKTVAAYLSFAIDYALCNLEADISKEHQDKLERLQV